MVCQTEVWEAFDAFDIVSSDAQTAPASFETPASLEDGGFVLVGREWKEVLGLEGLEASLPSPSPGGMFGGDNCPTFFDPLGP